MEKRDSRRQWTDDSNSFCLLTNSVQLECLSGVNLQSYGVLSAKQL